MQLFALDFKTEQPIQANRAQKQTNYRCLECQSIVRLRGGLHRQPHFYHLENNIACRQHQKGEIHLQLQAYLFDLLPSNDCTLECRFPSIQRIADVAWLSRKMIFEIQCSPISSDEVLKRNNDYAKLEWMVVWILHDRRFNQQRLSAAEMALRHSSHYFTNMTREGVGMIYDQFDIHKGVTRIERMPPLAINLSQPMFNEEGIEELPLNLLKSRQKNWKAFFKGDLKHQLLEGENSSYIQEAILRENRYFHDTYKNSSWRHFFDVEHLYLFFKPWKILYRYLLEKSCR